jgi:hypothetical protein
MVSNGMMMVNDELETVDMEEGMDDVPAFAEEAEEA